MLNSAKRFQVWESIMTIHSISIELTANAPKNVLFALLSDHEQLHRFFNANYILLRAGKPHNNGIGAIREVNNGFFTYQEQIIDFKENEHLHYKIITGAPIAEHGSWIKFISINTEQTKIQYHMTFSPKFIGTGWLIKQHIHRFIKLALVKLIHFSETNPQLINQAIAKDPSTNVNPKI